MTTIKTPKGGVPLITPSHHHPIDVGDAAGGQPAANEHERDGFEMAQSPSGELAKLGSGKGSGNDLPAPASWEPWEIRKELFELAKSASSSKSGGPDIHRILAGAVEHLQKRFNPQTKSAGSIPSEGDIETALLRAFNDLYKNMPEASRTIKKSDIQRTQTGNSKDGFLFEALKNFVSSNAARLSLQGTKPRSSVQPKSSGPVMNLGATVRRVVIAQGISVEIQSMARDLPDSETLARISAEAEVAGKKLSLFGTDESEIAAALSKNQERLRALKIIDELELARRAAIAVHTREIVNFDDPRIEEFYETAAKDLTEWVDNHAADLPIEKEPFLRMASQSLRDYIAIWLSEQSAGETMRRFDVSESAFEKTMALIEHSKEIEENTSAMHGLMARVLHHLARSDFSRVERERTSAQEAGAANAGPVAPQQRLASARSLREIFGDDLYAKLDEFYGDVLSGSVQVGSAGDPAAEASNFYEFMAHYARRCANEYGDKNAAAELRARGLEPRITKSIFLGVEGSAERFTNSTLELARLFFEKAIPEKTAAPAKNLKPTAREYEASVRKMKSSSRGGDGFIGWEYDFDMRKAMPLKTFLGQILGVGEPGFEEEFNSHNLGITWNQMMNWGEVRANPEVIGEKHWERIVQNWESIMALSVEEGSTPEEIPEGLSEFMEEYTPKDRSQESWLHSLRETRSLAELKELALANKPIRINDQLWAMYARWRGSVGRIEDLTVEPKSGDSLDAIMTAYDYLSALAAKYGQKIDFLEYLGCISPVVARTLLRSDDNNLIEMHEPELFHDILYDAWSYMLWAQRVRDTGHESYHEVRGSTFEAHASRDVRPELWDVRRYATRAMSEKLGIDREELIEFSSGYLRFAREISARTAVFDTRGAQISHRAPGMASKYRLQFGKSEGEHVTQGTSPSGSAERSVDDKIKSGHYAARIREMRTFLSTAALLMPQGRFLRADGSELTVADALKEFEEFSKEHVVRSSIFAEIGSSASMYSPDDIRDVRRFYAESFEDYSRALTDGASMRGEIAVGNFSVPLEMIYGKIGHAGEGEVRLSIGALAGLASKEKWSSQHAHDVAAIAVAVEYLVAIGEMTREEASDRRSLEIAVTRRAPIVNAPHTGAFSDYIRLAQSEGPERTSASKPTGAVQLTKKMQAHPAGVSKWQKLFANHTAPTLGMLPDETVILSDALAKYLQVAGSAKNRFWPKTLEKIVADSGIADKTAAFEALKSFLKNIGFETEHSIHSAAISSENSAAAIAKEIFEDYKAHFPLRKKSAERERIPANLELIAEISGLHLGEFGLPNAASDVKKFEGLVIPLVDEYNATASGSLRHKKHLPSEGMLDLKLISAAKDRGVDDGENIAAVRRSLFSMAGAIRRTELPADIEVAEALEKTGLMASTVSETAQLLKSTMEGQIESLKLINEAIDHPEYGAAKFLTDNYEAAGMSPRDFAELIRLYAALRLSGNLPAQIHLLAFESLDPAVQNHPALASHLATSYERIAAEWFFSAHSDFSDIIEIADISLTEISKDKETPPKNIEEIKSRVAESAGIAASFEEILEMEKLLFAMEGFLGIDATRTPITRKVERSFSGEISAAHASLDGELNDAVLRIRGFYSESLRLYAEAAALVSEPAAAEERSAKNQLERATSSWRVLTKQIAELEALTPLADRIAEIISLRNYDAAIAGALEKIPADIQIEEGSMPASSHELARLYIGRTGELLNSAETKIFEKTEAAEQTLAEIRAEARRIEVAKAASILDSFSSALEDKTGALIPILTEGVRAKLEKLDGIKSGLISDEAPSEEFLRDALLSSDALYKDATHGIDKSGGLAAEISDIVEQRNLLGQSAGLSESIAAAEGTLRTHGPDDLLEEALRRCKDAAEKAEAALSLFVGLTENIKTGIDSIEAALENYEDRVPIAPPFKQKTAEDVKASDAGEIADFNSKPISSRAHKDAAARLAAITDAKVISFREGSLIISAKEAEKFTSWKKNGRQTPLILDLATGEVMTAQDRQFGIRLADIRDIDPENPHVKTIRAARALANIRSSETAFTADIISSGQSALISSLLSALAQYNPSTGREGVLSTVSSWALRNLHMIPREIYLNYISLNKKNAPEPLSYTEEKHAAWRKMYELAYENPDMGLLTFYHTGPNGEKIEIWRRPVNIAEAGRSLKDNSGRIRFYDVQTARWVEQSLSDISSDENMLRFSMERLYRSSPIEALALKTNYSITADPELMKLAHLMFLIEEDEVLRRVSKTTSVDFPCFMSSLLSPISMAAHDVTPPLTMREAQAIALEAYNIVRGSAKKIDPSEVMPDSLTGWLQTTPFYDGTEQSLASLKKKGPLATRISNLMYMLFIYSSDPLNAIEASSMISKDKKAEARDFLERKFAEEAQSIYLNMHLPLLVSPDEGLLKSNPETLRVGSAQLWSMLNIFEPAMKVSLPASHSLSAVREILRQTPAWIRILMQRFPSLSRPLCLIALVYDQMPESFRDGLSKVMREVMIILDIYNPNDKERAKQTIISFYREHAVPGAHGHQGIIQALNRKIPGGHTLASWCSGSHDLAKGFKDRWEDLEPETVVRIAFPELAKLRPAVAAVLVAKMKEVAVTGKNQLADSILSFINKYPEMRDPVLSLSILSHNMEAESGNTALDFLMNLESSTPRNFVEFLGNSSNYKAIRGALKADSGIAPDMSTAVYLTGEEKPYIPTETLPPAVRIHAMIPSLANWDPKKNNFLREISQGENNKGVSNLLKIAEKHPEMASAVSLIMMVQLCMDFEERANIYKYFEGMRNPSPEALVDAILDLRLVTQLEKIAKDPGAIINKALLPSFDADRISPPSEDYIKDSLENLRMIPKKQSAQYAAAIARVSKIFKGRYGLQLDERYPETFLNAMIVAEAAQPDGALVEAMLKHIDECCEKEAIVSPAGKGRHLSWLAYRFLVLNRERVLLHVNKKQTNPGRPKKDDDDPRRGGGSSGGTPAGGSGRTSPPQTPHPTASASGKIASGAKSPGVVKRATPRVSQSSKILNPTHIDIGAAALLTYRNEPSREMGRSIRRREPAWRLPSGMPNAGAFAIRQMSMPPIHAPAISIASIQAFAGMQPMMFR